MNDPLSPIGFIALWRNKLSEYHSKPDEEETIREGIQTAFENARRRGVQISPLYYSRWASPWKYFTFWICPNYSILETAIKELEKEGDFKFAYSEHIIGNQIHEEGAEEENVTLHFKSSSDLLIGFIALWRFTPSFYKVSPDVRSDVQQKIYQGFSYSRAQGTHMVGIFDSRLSSKWDCFTFWQVPSMEVLENTIAKGELAGDFWLTESLHIVGSLERNFRSGRN